MEVANITSMNMVGNKQGFTEAMSDGDGSREAYFSYIKNINKIEA